MTTARDDILNRLRARTRDNQVRPASWPSNRQFDDLAAQFVMALNAVQGEAIHVATLDSALDHLGDLLHRLGAQRVVANDEPPLNTLDLPARLPAVEWHVAGRSEGDWRAVCASADVGLSGADVALTETGSLVVSSGPGKSRLVTLLPPVHIALVPVSRLVPDLFSWTATRPDPVPANQTIISGPSKSGDIAQILVLGMHGPRRFIVILFEDSA